MKRKKVGVGFRRGIAMSKSMMGGGCGCSCMPFFKGGCATCIPGGQHGGSSSLVGAPWKGGDIGSWPGVAGVAGTSNHYSLNNYNGGDPSYLLGQERIGSLGPSIFYGGKKSGRSYRGKRSMQGKKLSRRKFRGGGLIPQGIQNVANNMRFGLQSAGNALKGFPAPVNPNPTEGQFESPR